MTKNHAVKLLPVLMLCILVSIAQVFAQSAVTGSISGKIVDPQGSVVPNANITVTNIGTNSVTTATTSGDGVYKVTNLVPGTYKVETAVSGFGPAKAENVIVEVGKTTGLDISLALGTATAEVQVTAEAPVINTNDNANATNIDQTSIRRRFRSEQLPRPFFVAEQQHARRHRQQQHFLFRGAGTHPYPVLRQPGCCPRVSGKQHQLFRRIRTCRWRRH